MAKNLNPLKLLLWNKKYLGQYRQTCNSGIWREDNTIANLSSCRVVVTDFCMELGPFLNENGQSRKSRFSM